MPSRTTDHAGESTPPWPVGARGNPRNPSRVGPAQPKPTWSDARGVGIRRRMTASARSACAAHADNSSPERADRSRMRSSAVQSGAPPVRDRAADAFGTEISQNPRSPIPAATHRRRSSTCPASSGGASAASSRRSVRLRFRGGESGSRKRACASTAPGYISQSPHPEALGSALTHPDHHHRFLRSVAGVRDSRVPRSP